MLVRFQNRIIEADNIFKGNRKLGYEIEFSRFLKGNQVST